MTRGGRVTVPAGLRTALGLCAGDRLAFTLLDDGAVVMRVTTRPICELPGLLKHTETG